MENQKPEILDSKCKIVISKRINNEEAHEANNRWHCDIYCRKVRHVTCEGKSGIDPDSPKACPYLDEMLY